MDNKYKCIDTQKVNYKIKNKKRGEILYYSIDQVADLLNENVGNIKYYTNIFDDLLKIEIVHKELRYTNDDVDKLEFLIKLKNKGMSLKEIQDYYNKLPLNDSEVHHSESNLLSVEEIIDSIKIEQQIQFNNFKVQLFNEIENYYNKLSLTDTDIQHSKSNLSSIEELIDSIKKEQEIQFNNFKAQLASDIQNVNSLYLQNISSTIIDTQNKSLNEFKQDFSKEIKEYLNSKFDNVNEINKSLHGKTIANTTKLMSEQINMKNDELKLNLQDNFNILAESSLSNNEHLIQEIKDFKRVMNDAYYIQYQIEMDNANTGFWSKLFKIFRLKKV